LQQLDEADAILKKYGARLYQQQVQAARVTIAARYRGIETRPEYPDGLTEREVQVLRLIAAGKSNREIGDTLVISVRTVERHIGNIYYKIGARGKADATAYAIRNSLV
jgi:DNA-binding NarL/FixJ family response regulator